jgi:hypothetical protein
MLAAAATATREGSPRVRPAVGARAGATGRPAARGSRATARGGVGHCPRSAGKPAPPRPPPPPPRGRGSAPAWRPPGDPPARRRCRSLSPPAAPPPPPPPASGCIRSACLRRGRPPRPLPPAPTQRPPAPPHTTHRRRLPIGARCHRAGGALPLARQRRRRLRQLLAQLPHLLGALPCQARACTTAITTQSTALSSRHGQHARFGEAG